MHSGVGMAGWHGCMADSYREAVDYQFMVGFSGSPIPEATTTTRSTSPATKTLSPLV